MKQVLLEDEEGLRDMCKIEGQCILYGLKGYKELIDRVVKNINAEESYFDVRLVLTEALVNAFVHANKEDCSKPIFLKFVRNEDYMRFEIKDNGDSQNSIEIPGYLADSSLMECGGRGLYLINCYADKVQYIHNTLIIEMRLDKTGSPAGI